MQFEKAQKLFNSTTEEERANCNHSFEKEYYLGSSTGDYICKFCGEEREDAKRQAQNENEK